MLITAKYAWSPQNINALTRTLNECMCPALNYGPMGPIRIDQFPPSFEVEAPFTNA